MMVMMMAAMRSLRFHGALHVLNKRLERALCAGGVVRFERGLQRGEIVAERAVVAEQLAQWILAGVILQIAFEGAQGALGRSQIA